MSVASTPVVRWLSVEDVSRMLGVPVSSVRNGKMRRLFVKAGKHLRCPPDRLEQLLRGEPSTPAPTPRAPTAAG